MCNNVIKFGLFLELLSKNNNFPVGGDQNTSTKPNPFVRGDKKNIIVKSIIFHHFLMHSESKTEYFKDILN